MTEQIKFEVETERVLEILSREIYDSPIALLRENIQNAYDAILMRCARDGSPLTTGKIAITLSGTELRIEDNGIGMTEEVLRNNFWKAGSSGKRTKLASKAGVIGTFGIGAMANFGIATSLEIVTKSKESEYHFRSRADRQNLSIAEECISLDRMPNDGKEGTEIKVTLDDSFSLTENQAQQYLHTYVQYVPVEIKLNGNLISKQDLVRSYSKEGLTELCSREVISNNFKYNALLKTDSRGSIYAEISDITLGGTSVEGVLILSQGGGGIMGYRNYFGLSAIPVSSSFQLGGAANLSFLVPTAGREALSRESIAHIQNLITGLEKVIAEEYSKTDYADNSAVFQSYITKFKRFELANRVTIEVYPEREKVELGSIREYIGDRGVSYYPGRDQAMINQFGTDESGLLLFSQTNPRRQIQNHYVVKIHRISQIPDQATVLKKYSPRELNISEAALSVKVTSILEDDYFLHDYEQVFADITHGVQFKVDSGNRELLIARGAASIAPLLQCYDTSPEVFTSFVKDFVRTHVYPHIKAIVPSSTQGGAEALRRRLEKNRELYQYEENELGDLDPLLSDYISGRVKLSEVLRKSVSSKRPQRQSIQSAQVGRVESVIQDVTNSPAISQTDTSLGETEPRPAIMREEIECPYKVLTTTNRHANLNNFTLFLGLSDRLFKRERIFFHSPHTTRVMWAGHRVIYIFDHPSGKITLYYDIELKSPLDQKQANGLMVPTTTLILKNRLFVPVPSELENEFRISEGEKQFYVNFDTIP